MQLDAMDKEFKISGNIVTVDIMDYTGDEVHFVISNIISDPDCVNNSLQEVALDHDMLYYKVLNACQLGGKRI